MNSATGPEMSKEIGIPRFIYLKRILQLCFFPVFTVVVGNAAILGVPQARETLLAFDETRILSSQALWFILAFLIWMISAWYVTRLLVGKVFVPDLIGKCSSPAFSLGVTKHLPRLLALAAGLPMAIMLTWTGKPKSLGILLACLSTLVFIGLVFRRDVGRMLKQRWVDEEVPSDRFSSFIEINVVGRVVIAAALVLSTALFILLVTGMESIARPVGSPALVLFALASWTVFGGFVLTYVPKSYGIPALTWLPLLLAALFWPLNENHPVAPGSSVAPEESHLASRPALNELFASWQQQRADKDAPIIFVAVAGGASRAAYWATSALGKLEDEARARSSKFADNIFATSSISGGSVGAAAFVASLEVARADVGRPASECSSVRSLANAFAGQDHLSTVVGFMLYPDLVQRVLPFAVTSWDRSRALEEVWTRDWQRLLERCGHASMLNPWSAPFLSLYERTDGRPVPALALNTTALGHGWPAMQANFVLTHPSAFDVLSTDLATDALTLTQAAHNSARFPYVSPGGVVRTHQDRVWDRLGDGGYVEASGALTLGEILRELIRSESLCRRIDEHTCPEDQPSCGKCAALTSQVRVLVLDNQPTNEHSWLCSKGDGSAPGAGREERRHNLIAAAEKRLFLPDVMAPLDGAFSTRSGRAAAAEIDLLHLVDGCNNANYAELRLPKSELREPSMNWMLNRASRQQIDSALDSAGTAQPTHALLGENMQIARSWIK